MPASVNEYDRRSSTPDRFKKLNISLIDYIIAVDVKLHAGKVLIAKYLLKGLASQFNLTPANEKTSHAPQYNFHEFSSSPLKILPRALATVENSTMIVKNVRAYVLS